MTATNTVDLGADLDNVQRLEIDGVTVNTVSDSADLSGLDHNTILTEYAVGTAIDAVDFLSLPDTPSAYGASGGMYVVSATTDAVAESTTVLSKPAANQFQITEGTTAALFTGSGTFNQSCTTTSTPTFANVVSGTPSVDSHLATKAYVDTLFTGYVYGAKLTMGSTTVATIGTTGETSILRDDTNVYTMSFTGTKTVDLTVSGVGGIQTGSSRSTTTWYGIYVIGDTTGVNPPALLLIPNGTAFSQTGYDVKRRVGWAHTDSNGSGQFIPGTYVMGKGSIRQYMYDAEWNDTTIGLRVLTNGTSTTWTTVDLSPWVAPTSTHAKIRVNFTNSDGAAGHDVGFRPKGSVVPRSTALYAVQPGVVVTRKGFPQLDVPTDDAQQIEYAVANSVDKADVIIVGFTDEI